MIKLILSICLLGALKTPTPVKSAHTRTPYMGAKVVEVSSGATLFEDSPNVVAYPASVTKLMTALLVLEDVKAGKYSLSSKIKITSEVNNSEASWIGLKAGQVMVVEHLLAAMLVNSANDAAIALGVNASGSHEKFVQRMNQRASSLGMNSTTYYNANGLPPNSTRRYPWKSYNKTTASDQIKLALELLRKHPDILKYTSIKVKNAAETPVIDGAGRPYPLKNHNHVMMWDKLKVINPDGSEAVDGLKTGYINAGGSSIVITGKRGKKRVVAVVLGSSSSKERDEAARRLIADSLGALTW